MQNSVCHGDLNAVPLNSFQIFFKETSKPWAVRSELWHCFKRLKIVQAFALGWKRPRSRGTDILIAECMRKSKKIFFETISLSAEIFGMYDCLTDLYKDVFKLCPFCVNRPRPLGSSVFYRIVLISFFKRHPLLNHLALFAETWQNVFAGSFSKVVQKTLFNVELWLSCQLRG